MRLSCLYLGNLTLILAPIRCWEPKVLKQMSKHYKTNEPLSDELIEKLVRRCAGAVVVLSPFWTDSGKFSVAMSMSASSTCGSFTSRGLTIGCIPTKVSRLVPNTEG